MRRTAITVRGVVQGVGFRPFVYHAALRRDLAGWVVNEAGSVRIEVQGGPSAIDRFLDDLRERHPSQARVEVIEVREIPPRADAAEDCPRRFRIRSSETDAAPRPTIPADLATCAECLAEIRDPSERRHAYPFTNCTNCGPRWSIIDRLPYDRPRTSMAGFPMCDECRAEYENPADRRFHAQPIACPRCGPTLELLDADGRAAATGPAALEETVRLLTAGRIVAMKGLGGFQLLVDAANEEAVARLRARKRRPDRPLAIMAPSLDDVRRYCEVSLAEADLLRSPQSPIVLLRKCRQSVPLSGLLAPGNPCLGVMLPYTPLHHLLAAAVARPLVCTSGNLAEEPMATTADDAIRRLGPIADAMLTHDRPIVRPVDDSICRVGPDGSHVLRRARGFAPLPLDVPSRSSPSPTILAVGGHLKNTVALLLGGGESARAVMSAHVGDLDNVRSVEVFRRAIDDLTRFFHAKPEAVACDLHPDYASTRRAEELARQWGAPLVRVQHHHAHVAACMAENGLQGPVLGFAWDGAGYGLDGTVWGGETLLGDARGFRRAAHLRTFPLPGGDRAAREPRRSALGLLFEFLGGCAADYACDWFDANELPTLMAMLSRGVSAPRTSGMGRLFDAVAAICGLPPKITFEGQAAMALEFAADENEPASYPITLADAEADSLVLDWGPLVREALADRAASAPTAVVSARFHNALADAATAAADRIVPARDLPVVLTGGCFQNALLARRVAERLAAAGFRVYTHHQVPPGDGGIALGQVAVALGRMTKAERTNDEGMTKTE